MKKQQFSSQNRRTIILKHLNKRPISSFKAIDLYGFTRLSAIIFDLRSAGFNIQDRWCYGVNRYGHNIKWKEYYLVEKGE